jgi:hypothetical protein
VSVYHQVLEIALEQSAALGRGELESATALLDRRAELLAHAPLASAAELPLVEEILQLDRKLATALRLRMIAIRDEVRDGERGRKALDGYGRHVPGRPIAIDRLS